MKIGPYTITVTSDPKTINHKNFHRKHDLGFWDFDTQTIYVSPKQGSDSFKVSLFHEILHACIRLGEISHVFKSNSHEESLVEALAPILLDTLQSNSDLGLFQ